MYEKEVYSQSPQDIGSYLAGFVSDVHDGTTPSTQLKLRPALSAKTLPCGRVHLPKKKGIETRSAVDRL